ncbi:MAG: DUF456 domain-containing protein [Planctomycetota bacterium]|nr:DUF456 domain-containing protein [Planctomycetota bacterium]
MIYLYATLLLFANTSAWIATVFTLPGNWVLVLFTAIYAFFLPEAQPHVSWTVVGITLALAFVGEGVEFFAGAAGAAKQGGSRRGVMLAIVGAFCGSMTGAFFALPIPLIGPVIGALGGGAVGAFAGAWIGESGTGRTHGERIAIGKGALIGRLLGTAGKLIVGAIMLVLVTVDSFW